MDKETKLKKLLADFERELKERYQEIRDEERQRIIEMLEDKIDQSNGVAEITGTWIEMYLRE